MRKKLLAVSLTAVATVATALMAATPASATTGSAVRSQVTQAATADSVQSSPTRQNVQPAATWNYITWFFTQSGCLDYGRTYYSWTDWVCIDGPLVWSLYAYY
jgi:hypothetical protein